MQPYKITETELWAYISKTADISTTQKVEKWMASDVFDQELFDSTTAIYNNTIEYPSSVESSKKQLFDKIRTKEKPKKFPLKNVFRYAAIFAIIISGIYTYQQLSSNKNQIIVQTTFGEQKQLELSDGSTVWLNTASKLSYNKQSPRTLFLEGEAFFDVAKDTSHPFTVSTSDNLKVQALGTSFNVKSYINSPTTETKLLTGKVVITSDEHFKNEIVMIPNDKVTFYKDKKEVVKTKMEGNENRIAWKEGKIQFKNKVFREIAIDLKNQFNIKINFKNEQIANSKFTGSFDKTTPVSEILEILKISKDFSYELNTETNEWLIN